MVGCIKGYGEILIPEKGREYTHVASSMVCLLVVPYTNVLMCSVLLQNCSLDIINVDLW